jgi:hypothetical protein
MQLVVPSWFKQRQAKAEESGQGSYRVTGPNLRQGVIGVALADNLRWRAVLLDQVDGPEIDATGPVFENAQDALGAAFELYRKHLIN